MLITYWESIAEKSIDFAVSQLSLKNLIQILLFVTILLFMVAGLECLDAQSIRSGVTFQWSDSQSSQTDSATLSGVTVDGIIYDALTLPTSYTMLQVGPGGHSSNHIRQNGVQIESSSANASWNSSATAAFTSRNLNFKFEASASNNNANICDNSAAISSTSNQIQRLSYGFGVPATAGSILAVTERNANNCYYIRIFGTPVGGGAEQIIGGTFVHGGSTLWGATTSAPATGVDYWGSGRVNSNNGTIGIALFLLDPLVPVGSGITKVDFIAATQDHGDGKIFIMKSSAPIAADDDNAGSIDVGVGATDILNILTNDRLRGLAPTASSATISVVTAASHAGVTLDTASGNISVSAGVPPGTYAIEYQICETADPTNCDTATATVTVVGLHITKSSIVISDPVSGTSNPKAIPGATMRYCIQAENQANSVTAQAVSIFDDLLPMAVTFLPGTIKINGSTIAGECDFSTGTPGGSYSGTTVSGQLDDLPPGTTATLYFDVLVD
ncbi:MAG: hypothetical protein ABJC40_05320 [Parasphingorhabdus sp.]